MIRKFFLLTILTSLLLSTENCYEETIVKPSPFMGNHGEIFTLSNGIIGEVKHEYEYMYEYYPSVLICPSKNQLIISGKKLNIKLLQNNEQVPEEDKLIESQIDGEFEGFEGETIIKLLNGQIWQQAEYYYHYHYAYSPSINIFKLSTEYKIKIDGIDKLIAVKRLK